VETLYNSATALKHSEDKPQSAHHIVISICAIPKISLALVQTIAQPQKKRNTFSTKKQQMKFCC